jgi:endoglucanase
LAFGPAVLADGPPVAYSTGNGAVGRKRSLRFVASAPLGLRGVDTLWPVIRAVNDRQRDFLDSLLDTPSPSGFETRCQRRWIDHIEAFADEVTTDAYGNAVATYRGSEEGPEIALAGHADEIGLIVRDIDEEGFLRLGSIGGADRSVSQGQRVRIHASSRSGESGSLDGSEDPIAGVIGQTAIHLRERVEDSLTDIEEQYVDIGAADREEAKEFVEVGDPITFATETEELADTRLAARGMDNRIGIWAAAEALAIAAEREVETTIHAVSTIQEEVGLKGARMVGFDLAPDAVVAVDVTHATDHPDSGSKKAGMIALGEGPVIARGSTNHPELVDLAREAAAEEGVDVQLQASGSYTGTDADAFYTARGAIPTLSVGLPNRYMHTPVEVIDTEDLTAVAELLGSVAALASDRENFDVGL